METPLPIDLPPSRLRRTEQKPTVFSILLQTCMVISAAALTYVVLVREERYALGRIESPAAAVEQTATQSPPDRFAEQMVIPRSQ
jgi:hypothetical protein